MRVLQRLLLVLAISLIVGNVRVGSASAAVVVDDLAGAAELTVLVNVDRLAAGLAPLVPRGDVTAIAFEHSRRMAGADDIFHNDGYFDSETRERLGAKSRGENVALNRSVADAHERLMASPGHHANLVNPNFKIIGFGVVRGPDGTAFITEDFLEPNGDVVVVSAAPAVPAPSPIAVPDTSPPSPDPSVAPSAPEPPAPRPKKAPAPAVSAAPVPPPAPAAPPQTPMAPPAQAAAAPPAPAAEASSAARSGVPGELAALDLSLVPEGGARPRQVPPGLTAAASVALAAVIRAANRRARRDSCA